MHWTRIIPLVGALAIAPVAVHAQAAPAAAHQATSLRGSYALNATASDDVNNAIDRAVAKMNFVIRPIARRRLRGTNSPYKHVTIAYTQSDVSVSMDTRAPIVSPANGTPVKWKREDGEVLDVSTEWENGTLEQTFKADDGQRVNTYSLSPDGRTMTMHVNITSPKLPRPLQYKLVFTRG